MILKFEYRSSSSRPTNFAMVLTVRAGGLIFELYKIRLLPIAILIKEKFDSNWLKKSAEIDFYNSPANAHSGFILLFMNHENRSGMFPWLRIDWGAIEWVHDFINSTWCQQMHISYSTITWNQSRFEVVAKETAPHGP